jgi:hypothetical protein
MRIRRAVLSIMAIFALILSLPLSLPFSLPAQDKPSEYATLLAALKSGKTDIDYTRLRLSWMDSPEYKAAKDVSPEEKSMMTELNAKEYAKALKDSETVLDSEYVNIDAHYVAFIANRETGVADKAAFHRLVFGKLIDSILASGDGTSPEKAWVVITVHEEYVVLRALGFTPHEQSVMQKDGHNYDELNVKSNQDGADKTLYFNVDIPFKHYGV